MILTDDQMLLLLQNITETGNAFDPVTVFVRLFKSIAVHDKTAVMADVTQATGGAAIGVPITAWSAPLKLGDGRWCVEGPLCEFRVADETEDQAVSGWMYATLISAGVMKAFHEFATPIQMADEFHPLQILPRLCVDDRGNFDASVVITS